MTIDGDAFTGTRPAARRRTRPVAAPHQARKDHSRAVRSSIGVPKLNHVCHTCTLSCMSSLCSNEVYRVEAKCRFGRKVVSFTHPQFTAADQSKCA